MGVFLCVDLLTLQHGVKGVETWAGADFRGVVFRWEGNYTVTDRIAERPLSQNFALSLARDSL